MQMGKHEKSLKKNSKKILKRIGAMLGTSQAAKKGYMFGREMQKHLKPKPDQPGPSPADKGQKTSAVDRYLTGGKVYMGEVGGRENILKEIDKELQSQNPKRKRRKK
jgi:hypothetical protein